MTAPAVSLRPTKQLASGRARGWHSSALSLLLHCPAQPSGQQHARGPTHAGLPCQQGAPRVLRQPELRQLDRWGAATVRQSPHPNSAPPPLSAAGASDTGARRPPPRGQLLCGEAACCCPHCHPGRHVPRCGARLVRGPLRRRQPR